MSEAVLHSEPPGCQLGSDGRTLALSGAWVTDALAPLEKQLQDFQWPNVDPVTLTGQAITAMDTGGAWLVYILAERLRARGRQVRFSEFSAPSRQLLDLVEKRLQGLEHVEPPRPPGLLEQVGRNSMEHLGQATGLLAFIGETVIAVLRSLIRPRRIRWRAILADIQASGVNALPITGLLSFLIGVVIAYQGGVQLRNYGASIFIVDLVGLTMLRELAPMMAAIIVAGRTGSAYTAQIGTMKITEEVDALRTMGLSPMDLLVLPKLFGLMLALPLLTVFADAVGVLGGMVMALLTLDVSAGEFLRRIPQVVSVKHYLLGLGKAPVFAAIIAIVGCFQGFQVQGGADSVGRQTTLSVVQGIFLVIVADAAFSVLFSWLGI